MFFNNCVSVPFYAEYRPEIHGNRNVQGFNCQLIPHGVYGHHMLSSQINPQFPFQMFSQCQNYGTIVLDVGRDLEAEGSIEEGDYDELEKQEKKKQNPTRNMNSNAMKYFVKFIKSAGKVERNVDLIVKLYNLENYSRKDFMETFKNIFPAARSYIRPSTIAELCSNGQKQAEKYPECGIQFRLILRVLLHRFIVIDYFPFIVKMKKIKIRERKLELQSMRRQLLHLLIQ